MEYKNIVYVVGAGASKDFGLPLGYEIFQNAYLISKSKRTFAAKNEMNDILNEVESYMRSIFPKLPRNKLNYPPFEEVLTFIWESRKSERLDTNGFTLISLFNHKKGAEGVFNKFVKLLGLTLSIDMSNCISKSKLEILKTYIASIDFINQNVSFISLNYDLIIDNILFELAKEKIISGYNYGYSFDNIATSTENNEFIDIHHRTLLLKPHGSLNLAYCPHPYRQGYYYHNKNFFTNVEILNNQIKCPICGSIPKPLIIPPLYNKNDYIAKIGERTHGPKKFSFRSNPENFREIIDPQISKLLGNADEIIIIGYSMPPYDFDFKSLFISSLMHHKKREKLKIRIITKCNKIEIEKILGQYRYLVGKVSIESNDGFYNYISAR
jgi:hypothetical protein